MPWQTTAPDEAIRKRRWAIVRLTLGQLQVMGATCTLFFLVTSGENKMTYWSCGVTALITVTSLYLFKVLKKGR
jgi:hypothetical protein